MDSFVNAPTTRTRPLCPYPQQARFTGTHTVVNGVPVALNPSDLANSVNYTCIRRAADRRCHRIELQRSKPGKGGSLPPFSLFTPSTRRRHFRAADVM